jgi:hypothetical protein
VPAPTSPRSLQDSLTGVASRWLDAYYRQDRATMNAISPRVTVSDNRGEKDRMPRGLPSVQRSLDGVSFNVAGSAAMLTARMTERSDNATSGRMTVSYISHIWTQQRNGEWQLDDVTIASAASVGQKVGR